MAGKKKSMDGGRLSGFLKKKPTDTIQVLNDSNTYLKKIRELEKSYSKIDSKISVNNLNTKVKLLSIFSQEIKNKEELMPLLDAVKGTLIQKLFEKLGEYNAIFQNYDSYNFSELLSILQDFEKLTDQINLLGGGERYNFSSLKIKKNNFIAAMLDKYEEEILYKLKGNSNSQIQLLKKEVEDYISKYSQFTVEIGAKRGANNSINSIVHRLSELFEKISKLSTNNTRRIISNQTGLQQNSSKEFQVNNRPTTLKESLNNAQKGYRNDEKDEKIREIANKTFDLLSHKFDLAIKFLDTIGQNSRLQKGLSNSLVNNAVYEDKDLAKNIGILHDLWLELINEHLSSFKNNYKTKLKVQALTIEDKKQNYSQKMLEKQKYVNYK